MSARKLFRQSMKRSWQLARSSNHGDLSLAVQSHFKAGMCARFDSASGLVAIEFQSAVDAHRKRFLHTRDVDDHRVDFDCEGREVFTESAGLPPLPEPVYSVRRRVLPSILTAMSSAKGRKYLLESLMSESADSFWILVEQFTNQSEPAYCGITTLAMVLNAMSVDPRVRWRGGWRFYGSEDVLLDRCCISAERVKRIGIHLEEFKILAKCHGLGIEMKRPGQQFEMGKEYSLESFRDDVRSIMTSDTGNSVLVVSFSRSLLGQTGEGHFSPLAAYHSASDQVLVLDVARFKYPPYWVSIEILYNAMLAVDESTTKCRGWFLLHPPNIINGEDAEGRLPADLVPELGEVDACPVGELKRRYCRANQAGSME